MKTHKQILVWDLGATKCAAAVMLYDEATQQYSCREKCNLKLTAAKSLAELIQQMEAKLNFSMQQADAICIGAAGMFDGERLHLDNGYPYSMPLGILAKELGWPIYTVIHDYAPIVCGTFVCDINATNQVQKLNNGLFNQQGRRVAFGVGTGLGLKDGVLLGQNDFWLGTNEAGHLGLVHPPLAETALIQRHNELVHYLRSNKLLRDDEALTFEKILSGRGTLRLYQFLHPEQEIDSPEAVGQRMRDGKSDETVALFAWYLGLFVGSVQLAFMPDGGIWMTGGVLQSHLDVFEHSDFWRGIEATPAYLAQRQKFPLFVLRDSEHVFKGGAFYAVSKLLR